MICAAVGDTVKQMHFALFLLFLLKLRFNQKFGICVGKDQPPDLRKTIGVGNFCLCKFSYFTALYLFAYL